ncbi:hypothetical protein EJB05_11723, partial [Eragrostis curvula]
MKGKVASTALVLLLLTMGSEATMCNYTSIFDGCMSTKNCASACIHEGSIGGYCKHIPGHNLRHCTCFKNCDGAGGSGGGKAPPMEMTQDNKPMTLTAGAWRARGHA